MAAQRYTVRLYWRSSMRGEEETNLDPRDDAILRQTLERLLLAKQGTLKLDLSERVCGLLLPRRQRRGPTTMTDHTRRVRIRGNLCHPTIPAGAVRVTRPTCPGATRTPSPPMAVLRPWRRYRQYLIRDPT